MDLVEIYKALGEITRCPCQTNRQAKFDVPAL